MKTSFDIIYSVLPVLALFGLGYVLQKIRFFKPESVQDMKQLVASIALPSLLFIAFSTLTLEARFLVVVVLIFLVCILMLFIGNGIAKLLHISSPYFPLLLSGFEMGMLGYAIFIAVYGMGAIDKIAIIDLGQVIFVFFVLMALLMKMRDGAQNARQLVKLFLSSPVIIAIFAGLLVSIIKTQADFTDHRLYQLIHNIATTLGNVTVPLICLVIGYEFTFDMRTLRRSAQTILIRTVVLLVLAVLINKLIFVRVLHLAPIYEYALLTMFVLPPPFVIAIFMKQEDADNRQYVVNTLSLSTMASLVVFILVMSVYR